MKCLMRCTLMLALAAMVAPCAWGAVSVTWTDGAGPQAVDLAVIANPNYDPGDPLCMELPYVWYGELNVVMSTTDPIVFSFTGNFIGGPYAQVLDQVRIDQNVLNCTCCAWDQFDINVLNMDGEFYKVNLAESGWTANKQLWTCSFTSDAPEYNVLPGGEFNDGLDMWAYVDYGTGDGSITIEKQPTCVVPEPGCLAGVLGGLGAMLGLLKRRRA